MKEYAMVEWTVANIVIYKAFNIFVHFLLKKLIVLFDSHIVI